MTGSSKTEGCVAILSSSCFGLRQNERVCFSGIDVDAPSGGTSRTLPVGEKLPLLTEPESESEVVFPGSGLAGTVDMVDV